jgi:hypothetical protein
MRRKITQHSLSLNKALNVLKNNFLIRLILFHLFLNLSIKNKSVTWNTDLKHSIHNEQKTHYFTSFSIGFCNIVTGQVNVEIEKHKPDFCCFPDSSKCVCFLIDKLTINLMISTFSFIWHSTR